jgi:hypothetical protein
MNQTVGDELCQRHRVNLQDGGGVCNGECLDLAVTGGAMGADRTRLGAEDAAMSGSDLQFASSFHQLAASNRIALKRVMCAIQLGTKLVYNDRDME